MKQVLTLNYDKYTYTDFSICIVKNTLKVTGRWGTLTKILNANLFFNCASVGLFFFSPIFLRLFLSLLYDMIVGVCFRWFLELEMKGLGFKTFFSNAEKLYKIDLGYNHYIFYPLSNELGIKTKRRSRFIIIFGIDKIEVFNLTWKILNFRQVTSYKFRGIKFRHLNLKLKVGKKKQFF